MDSESYAALRAIAEDPWLWIGGAALFLGIALGQTARALVPDRRGKGRPARKKSRRIARAVAYLSLALLCATALLVFPPKAALDPAALTMEALAPYAAALGAGGILAGLLPLACGLPIAAISVAGILALGAALEGWTPYRGALTVARLLPYEVGPSSFRGELEIAGPGSGSGSRPVTAAAGAASICVDALELSGPLGLLARAFGPGPMTRSYEPARRFYRVAAMVSPGAAAVFMDAPARSKWIDAILPLPEGAGLEPGGALARSETLAALAVRVRSSGPARALVALEPVYFDLDEDEAPRIAARQRPSPGWVAK